MGHFKDPTLSPKNPFRLGKVTKEEQPKRSEKRDRPKLKIIRSLNAEANDTDN